MRLLTYATTIAALSAAALGAPPALLLALGLALCGWIAVGLLSPRSGIFARPFCGVAGGRGEVALTFDDGPDPETTAQVLALLAARGHRATFFVIGRRARAHPELLREIAREGHAIGNHSDAHAWSTPLWTTKRLARDLDRAQQAIESACGAKPTWFRPPIGLFGPRIEPAARRAGLRLAAWTLRSNDGALWGAKASRVLSRVVRRVRDGDVILLHDRARPAGGAPLIAQVLPPILDALAEKGLRSVTLDELCRLPGTLPAKSPA